MRIPAPRPLALATRQDRFNDVRRVAKEKGVRYHTFNHGSLEDTEYDDGVLNASIISYPTVHPHPCGLT